MQWHTFHKSFTSSAISVGWHSFASIFSGNLFSSFNLSGPISDVHCLSFSPSSFSNQSLKLTPHSSIVDIACHKAGIHVWCVRASCWASWCFFLSYAVAVVIRASKRTSVILSIMWSPSGITWSSCMSRRSGCSLQDFPSLFKSSRLLYSTSSFAIDMDMSYLHWTNNTFQCSTCVLVSWTYASS